MLIISVVVSGIQGVFERKWPCWIVPVIWSDSGLSSVWNVIVYLIIAYPNINIYLFIYLPIHKELIYQKCGSVKNRTLNDPSTFWGIVENIDRSVVFLLVLSRGVNHQSVQLKFEIPCPVSYI